MFDQAIAGSRATSGLRGRIGWICHTLRIAAVAWIAWILGVVLWQWSDRQNVLELYTRYLEIDLTGISSARYFSALALVLVDWAAAVVVAVCLWRLAGTYLAGRVFTVDAASWLHRTGITALIAIGFDVLARPAIMSVLAGDVVVRAPAGFFLYPHDLLHLIFAAFVLALAHIFKAAAEMADEQAQFV